VKPVADAILVLNAGSSSLKFSVFLDQEQPQPLISGHIEELLTHPRFEARGASGNVVASQEWETGTNLGHERAVEFLLGQGNNGVLAGHRIVAAGHRVVHGGTMFVRPVRIDDDTTVELEKLIALAPLQQPHNLAAIRAVARYAPRLPQVACFDTSFHRTQPQVAEAFALPRRYTAQGVRRYGFHGLSYEYIASVLSTLDDGCEFERTVVAHLGNGASMCALRNGKSIATTMGLTAMDGLPMGTRCGSLDPGVLLYLLRSGGLDPERLEHMLYHESGLLGVSAISSDVRTLLASSDVRAAEALDVFVYRIGRELGSLAAALGGIDALVLTGGIGENAIPIRARICAGARWLGVDLDEQANAAGGPRISRAGSRVSAWVVRTNEELMIARHTRRVLGTSPCGSATAGTAADEQLRSGS
jgi:acetate kinase